MERIIVGGYPLFLFIYIKFVFHAEKGILTKDKTDECVLTFYVW